MGQDFFSKIFNSKWNIPDVFADVQDGVTTSKTYDVEHEGAEADVTDCDQVDKTAAETQFKEALLKGGKQGMAGKMRCKFARCKSEDTAGKRKRKIGMECGVQDTDENAAKENAKGWDFSERAEKAAFDGYKAVDGFLKGFKSVKAGAEGAKVFKKVAGKLTERFTGAGGKSNKRETKKSDDSGAAKDTKTKIRGVKFTKEGTCPSETGIKQIETMVKTKFEAKFTGKKVGARFAGCKATEVDDGSGGKKTMAEIELHHQMECENKDNCEDDEDVASETKDTGVFEKIKTAVSEVGGTFVSKIGTKIASWKEKAGEIVADKVKTVNRVEAPVDSNDKTRNGNKGGRYKLTLRLKNFKDLATDKKDKIRAGLKEKFGEVFGVKDAASDKKKVDIVEKGEEEEEKDETFTADATTTLKDWASKGRKKVTSTIVDVYTYFDKTISTKKDQFKAGAKNFLQNAKSNFDPAALAQKIKDKAGDLGDFAIEKVSDMKFEEVGEGATCSKPSKEWTWTPDAEDRTPKKWKKERRLLAGDFVKSKFGSTFSFEGTFKGKECGEQEVVTKVEQLRANICKKTNEFLGKTPTADEEKNQRPGLLNKVNRKKIDDAKCTAQEKSCTPRVVCDVSGDDDKKSDVRKGAQN